MTKVCPKCNKELDISCFHKHKGRSDGYSVHCKECRKEYGRLHRANHPEAKRTYERKRRAIKASVKEHYTTGDELYTRALFNNTCANCGYTQTLCIDHHYPLSAGNPLTRKNAVILCNSCNASKSNKLPEEFYTTEKLQYIQEKLTAVNG